MESSGGVKPPLRRLHSDRIYDRPGTARSSLLYHRQKNTEELIESLRPGAKSPLLANSDGTVVQGNTRIKVLEERGYPVDELWDGRSSDEDP